jgi:ribosomal protein L29
MAIIKTKEIKKLNKNEREEKIKDLKMELIKSRVNKNKEGKQKPKEIKKTIARLLTFNRLEETIKK